MQFLSVSRRKSEAFTEAQFAEKTPAEWQRARAMYAEGTIRQLWARGGDTPGACILWEAENEQHVRELLGSLPMAQAGMLEILALVPLKPYPGFSASNR
ncbi:MAG: muconolactone Delta-isomerase family protein [Terracidiphilus sp.]